MSSETTTDLGDLVQPGRVPRRVYADPEIFELEMERIFGRIWVYVGHESQVTKPGDFAVTRIGRRPMVMVRHTNGKIHVIHNQCAHRGAMVVAEDSGNAAGQSARTRVDGKTTSTIVPSSGLDSMEKAARLASPITRQAS